jgi:hypothetical protein
MAYIGQAEAEAFWDNLARAALLSRSIGRISVKSSIEGLEIRGTTNPDAFNVYLREHPIGTVVHSGARTAHGADSWYVEHPRDAGPLDESDFFSNPDAAAVFLVRRLGLA